MCTDVFETDVYSETYNPTNLRSSKLMERPCLIMDGTQGFIYITAKSGDKSGKSYGTEVHASRGKVQEAALHSKRYETESHYHVVH